MRKSIFNGFHNLLRQFVKGAELLALTSLFSMLVACQDTPTKQKQTNQNTPTEQKQTADGFYRLLSDESVKLDVIPREIRRSTNPQTFSQAAVEQHIGSRRKYINEELNSRSPILLKSGDWKIKWQTDLPSSFPPSAILEANNRIVVESDGIWYLFDSNGKKLLHNQLGAS